MNRVMAIFGLSMIALWSASVEAAPKAQPEPIACVEDVTAATPVTADCIDLDGDKFPSNAADETLRDVVDDPSVNVFARFAYPGAPIAIGDGLDTDQDGSDDDSEWAEMVEAAGGEDSPGWTKLEAIVTLCLQDKNEATYGLTFAWAVDKGVHTCVNLPAGAKFDSVAGVQLRPIVVEERRRIAADKATKAQAEQSVAALQAEIGSPGKKCPPVEKPVIEGQEPGEETSSVVLDVCVDEPATGLYGSIASAEQRLATANAADRAAIKQEIADYKVEQKKITDELDRRVDAIARRQRESEENGLVFLVGAEVGVVGQRQLLASEDGPVIREGVASNLGITVVQGFQLSGGNSILIDLGAGLGSTGTSAGAKPVTSARAAVVFEKEVNGTRINIGGGPLVLINAVGDPVAPDATGTVFGAELRGSLRLPSKNDRVCHKVTSRGLVGVEGYGFNDFRDSGAYVGLSVGLETGICPIVN